MSRKQSQPQPDAAPETPAAVVSTLGETPAPTPREPVVEDLGNGTVKETF
jgi:hypothetical protein